MATTIVPFLADIAMPVAADGDLSGAGNNMLPEALCQRTVVRPAWKQYITAVLPHAERGLWNFMLTTVAEGRGGEDDDEKDHTRGPDILCDLSLQKSMQPSR